MFPFITMKEEYILHPLTVSYRSVANILIRSVTEHYPDLLKMKYKHGVRFQAEAPKKHVKVHLIQKIKYLPLFWKIEAWPH